MESPAHVSVTNPPKSLLYIIPSPPQLADSQYTDSVSDNSDVDESTAKGKQLKQLSNIMRPDGIKPSARATDISKID